ncbi:MULTISPECIES: NAD(P)H-binding protein [Actinomadura]|uniref:NAD(P)H-binding protein n=1 Tax=Actinomadura yumaensis TaxID=111807 RepID=A0ABW2CS10_9ACTN|nr:NAD(P)H-binding protein [Actinomadura sp. J1-007]MWK37365.1 NAD(P)H-binding protein [Actinomadura sp. J1-007]
MTILVTGARGRIARSLVQQLLSNGAKVRAAGREPAAAQLPEGVEAVAADLADPDTFGPALDGVAGVFLYAEPRGLDGFVAAARSAGVRHIVLLSAIGASTDSADPIARMHGEAERAVAASGIARTLLRPGGFATNTLSWAPTIRADGTVHDPFPESHSTPIHEADIAAVAARALTEPGHEGAVYELTGPESVTRREQADLIGEAIGQPVRFVLQSLDDHRESLAQWGPPEMAEILIEHAEDSVGRPARATDTVRRVTGRDARPYAEWARDHAPDFTGGSSRPR